MPTARRGIAVSDLHCQSLPFLFLGELSGFGNITMPLMTHDHNRRGFLVEWSITRNH